MSNKSELREQLRALRRVHVEAQPDRIRALLFHRPPAPIVAMIEPGAVIGLYHASRYEAPASAYAGFFAEQGHVVALPHFGARDAAMTFRAHTDPFGASDLAPGPFGLLQPAGEPEELVPDVLFVPLVGFTETCERLGQGGGHYDRWLAEHPGRLTIGLAWDAQLIEPASALPLEPHDHRLDAVVTPTRIYRP
ncbi:5-formyltetrahydrofolate cyclo-ligase [Erythrobacter sp.]|uniref:5-formyltetrahydrofolate cyclo-ligase n=1 Tax=Erythrobacter sp. TaxID=1042 RepID=UPI001425C1F1|nr:5-formyltetrahydrofolate cyclo-ligase [Erythrobacter sp.]QIQ86248.1 MAG: 5-formyltetrahydrofolate cyclo-ligase [Erythrobacter sp.]